jgi:hypothetical protein
MDRPARTRKETIEYDSIFLDEWNRFCDSKGFSKRQAAHAARIAFMRMLGAPEREAIMGNAMPYVIRSRKRGEQRLNDPSIDGDDGDLASTSTARPSGNGHA